MKLQELIHAPTRLAWKLRLLVYIAIVVSLTLVVQVVHAVWL